MLSNYLNIAVRNLLRQPLYSLINVIGLGVGIAACVVVFLFLRYEYGYDRHFKDVDRIHRVIRVMHLPDGRDWHPVGLQGPVGPAMVEEMPEVVESTRFLKRPMWAGLPDRGFDVGGALADANFITFFGFIVLKGDAAELERPDAAFVTASLARKLYGDADPIGKPVSIDYKWVKGDFVIAGVLADHPATQTSEFDFDILVNWRAITMSGYGDRLFERWSPESTFIITKTFVRLGDGAELADVQAKMRAFAIRHLGEEIGARDDYHVFPLTRQHLHARGDYGLELEPQDEPLGDIQRCTTFGLVGLFILLLACINFTNLATARAARRSREVGVRKAVGATRGQLRSQFLGESVLLAVASSAIALLLAALVLPSVNEVLSVSMAIDGLSLAFAFALALVVGGVAGLYPAVFLSSMQAVNVLKGSGSKPRSSRRLRQGLVTFQFAVSIVLIIATLVTYRQVNLIHTKDLGFRKEGRILLRIFGSSTDLRPQFKAVKARFADHPSVIRVSAALYPPGRENDVDLVHVRVAGGRDSVAVHQLSVDQDYLDLFEIPLLDGRVPTDDERFTGKLMLNQSAAKALGAGVGSKLRFWDEDWEVVGLFADYHNGTLHRPLRPLMMLTSHFFSYIIVQARLDNVPETIAHLQEAWRSFLPNRPFTFEFYDEFLDGFYRTEIRMQRAFTYLCVLAIGVACLGLLGLIAYTTEVRTKEIAVRKAIGSSSRWIVLLLVKDFAVLIGIAAVLAWPVAYLLAQDWLAGFAYRIDLGPDVFLIGGLAALAVAMLTVGGQAIRAASRNPAEALRD